MGALLTTFGVGELSAINAIAGSFAEYVPVVHIAGSPSVIAQKDGMLLHHSLGDGNFQVFTEMYKHVTCAQANLHDINTAPAQIDHVLRECWVQSRPAYIELPADIAMKTVDASLLERPIDTTYPQNVPEAETAAVQMIIERLYAAKRPCVLVDGCVMRRRLTSDVDAFLRHTNLPVFVAPMGKSAVNETLPNFCGMYAGSASHDAVKEYIEGSDLVLSIGSIKSDFNTMGFSYRLSTLNSIDLHTGIVSIGYSNFALQMRGVIKSLTQLIDVSKLSIEPFTAVLGRSCAGVTKKFKPSTITQEWLWTNLSHWLKEGDILLTETGTSYLGVMDTQLKKGVTCVSQTLWGSIGYTLPAAQGAALAAKELGKNQRVILFEGDGSFQMTAQAVGTMLRNNLDIIIFLINNDGYTIERWIHGMDEKYNDVQNWKYASIPKAMGGEAENSTSYSVDTTDGLQQLWSSGRFDKPKGLHFVEMFTPREDAPVTLKLLCNAAGALNEKSE